MHIYKKILVEKRNKVLYSEKNKNKYKGELKGLLIYRNRVI